VGLKNLVSTGIRGARRREERRRRAESLRMAGMSAIRSTTVAGTLPGAAPE
jgi:hypothetical protein